jgi:5,10-methylenetetrahydromethanopterin reductase
MAPPFRISIVQLTMEPVHEQLALARAADTAGFDVFWLGEAYPWWRTHGMEARSSTAISALIAHETSRIGVGWGIVSPYTRHPIQIAMEARVLQELAGPGRFYLGLGASRIFMRETGDGRPARPLTAVREAIEIVRGVLRGDQLEYEGTEFSAAVPLLAADAEAPRHPVPVYLGGTGPRMLEAAGEVSDGLLTASITTPAFVRYARKRMHEGAERAGRDPEELDLGAVLVASIDDDPERGRAGAREIAGMYLANKVQNIGRSADVLLEKAGLDPEEIRPISEALVRGGRAACASAVTDEVFARVKPVAGTPGECADAIDEYRQAGCTHILLELWGDDRIGQVELFGREVLPRFRD